MKAGFTFTGLEQIDKQLRTLPIKAQKKVVRGAVRVALKPMLQQAKANAKALPVTERWGGKMASLLARNIVIKAPRRQRPGSYSLHVQMRPGVPGFRHTAKGGQVSYVPAAIEFGHGPDKESSARPFMRPAAKGRENQVRRDFMQQMGRGLMRAALETRTL